MGAKRVLWHFGYAAHEAYVSSFQSNRPAHSREQIVPSISDEDQLWATRPTLLVLLVYLNP